MVLMCVFERSERLVRSTVRNQGLKSRDRFDRDDQRFNIKNGRYQSRNRGSSENFCRGDRRHGGRLNVLKVQDDQVGQSQSVKDIPIRVSAICMCPVELPYVPILLNETFTKAVVAAQGAKCRNIAVVELQVRIRGFMKPWQFHVLEDLEYPCIQGVDFISGSSKIVLDFDKKSLAIPDSQVEKIIPSIDEGNLDIDLAKTGLEKGQKLELQDLFNSFKGLFSDKPGLTHVLYYKIDTGDKPPVASRPYRYDRVKQGILDYHVKKMLKGGNIIPIQSPYASPVVLCRKNNGLPPDNPEALSICGRLLEVKFNYKILPLSLTLNR
ncbi:uncharacterized protein TNCV_4458071 [Trichonephila clavipes]|nr:uncharacterized protein TNCV_4458071 [Trichonephila clavipes]